jgi:hypothetical protein
MGLTINWDETENMTPDESMFREPPGRLNPGKRHDVNCHRNFIIVIIVAP